MTIKNPCAPGPRTHNTPKITTSKHLKFGTKISIIYDMFFIIPSFVHFLFEVGSFLCKTFIYLTYLEIRSSKIPQVYFRIPNRTQIYDFLRETLNVIMPDTMGKGN